MTTRVMALACASALGLTGLASAQAPAPPRPGAEHRKLGYFAGKWTSEGEMKPSPLGPGGKFSATESCEWFAGGFHLVCRSEMKGPMGEMKGIGILTWSAEEKAYKYQGIDSLGTWDSGTGSTSGDTWTWNGETKTGGKLVKSRYISKTVSPDAYTFKWEMASEGGPYSTVMEGKGTRVK